VLRPDNDRATQGASGAFKNHENDLVELGIGRGERVDGEWPRRVEEQWKNLSPGQP
jgi:hypothetical protein